MQLNDLMQLLDAHDHLNVFLLAGSTNKTIVSILSRYYENNPERFKRIVVCSRSPIIIYQVELKLLPRLPHSMPPSTVHLSLQHCILFILFLLVLLFACYSCVSGIHV